MIFQPIKIVEAVVRTALNVIGIGIGVFAVMAICVICVILFLVFLFTVYPRLEAEKYESYGEIPAYASKNGPEWQYAQYTSWWGKRLDPEEFWKGRTIWLDASATDAARRHGRDYPPIPSTTNNAWLAPFSDKDEGSTSGGPDSGPFITFYGSYRERVYWDKFWRTHPKPPEDLAREQSQTAEDLDIPNVLSIDRSREIEAGYPPEAFTDDALRFCKAHDQSKASAAWKISYLQRLRREHTDDSYINAYLNAWNLSATEVFSTNSDVENQSKITP